MAYSKTDFFHWDDDLNLDDILGDYTCSSEEDTIENKTVPQKAKKGYLYQCSECEKSYKSISGIRGHMTSKHGLAHVKASDYNTAAASKIHSTESSTAKSPFIIDKNDFMEVFDKTLQTSLHNVAESQFRKLGVSIHGKGIIQLSNLVSEDKDKVRNISSLLFLPFYEVFNSCNRQDLSTKEAIFMLFHEMSLDILQPLVDLVNQNIDEILPFRQFSAVPIYILEDLVASRSDLYKKAETNSSTELSKEEQQILFYLSGFLIRALQKRLKRMKSGEKEALVTGLELMQVNRKNSSNTVSQKFADWTDKLNRGGLKVPSDDMFFLVRELENQCRSKVKENHLATDTLNVQMLKETIMDKFMVKYYAEKLVPGQYSPHILERTISIFLTIRGNACARKKKMELTKNNEKKALRKVLKEKSSN